MNKKLSAHVDFRLVPLGATLCDCGCYFSIWCPKAKSIVLHLFDKNENEIKKIVLTEKRGSIWYCFVEDVTAGTLYAYEAIGDYAPELGLFFQKDHLLVDPYAKGLSKPYIYTKDRYENHYNEFLPKAIVEDQNFDWQGVIKPSLGKQDLVIYECNVKGSTILNEKVPSAYRGKFLGLCDDNVIAHFKKLGITVIQLNPIAAFVSEPHLEKHGLVDYWGYNPVSFMVPDPRYAVDPHNTVNEFKTMVRELHKNGIAVILDVVYNHTGEGGEGGSVFSLKGFDAQNYYAHPKNLDGTTNYSKYLDVTGCGNSVNTDSRPTVNLVLDSLSYWLSDLQVDGFRFDLAVTICRESSCNSFYEYDKDCTFLKATFCIDVINQAILIAEPWDIGHGGYRLGQFPDGWSEQNDKFRDAIRRFWRGDKGLIGEYVTRIMGSRDIFKAGARSINASVNFVTYHDGFTLQDLVSYTKKYNEANGENNVDGSDNNNSTNCGFEGPTSDPVVREKRWQLKRNLITATLLSQGIPHFLGGDEFSRTQQGNNNGYCQDNEISWTKWDYSKENKDFIDYISLINNIRHESNMLRELLLVDDSSHLTKDSPYEANWYKPDGLKMHSEDWNNPNTDAIAFVAGAIQENEGENWCFIFSQSENETLFKLPLPHVDHEWIEVFDSANSNGLPSECDRSGIKAVTLRCPSIRGFKLRRTSLSKLYDTSSVDFVTIHINRS